MPREDEYARAAPFYDLVTAPFLRAIRRDVAQQVKALAPKFVLDICCGTGRQLLTLHSGPTLKTGVDLSGAMLGQAPKSLPNNVPLLQANACDLPFASDRFDICLVAFALHEKSPESGICILREARRVLTPDGTILVLDYRAPDRWHSVLAHKGISLIEHAAGADHYRYYRRFLSTGGLPQLTKKADLTARLIKQYFYGSIGLYAVTP